MMSRIAVVGAGYAGIAMAWHLAQLGFCVTVFDKDPIGTSASGISAGLLHTYTGLDAKPAWNGSIALESTKDLLNIAAAHAQEPVYQAKGILRVAVNARQAQSYRARSGEHEDVLWLEPAETVAKIPGVIARPSIYLKNGLMVNGLTYLTGLWKACQALGCRFVERVISELDMLTDFDHVVICAGAEAHKIAECAHLRITPVKGQMLELEWPQDHPPLACPVNSQIYCVMSESQNSCFVGATYERHFTSACPDLETAKNDLLPKAIELLPFLATAKILGIRAGVRASTPNHLPITMGLTESLSILAGLGSKGLLYHALLAKTLAKKIWSAAATPQTLP